MKRFNVLLWLVLMLCIPFSFGATLNGSSSIYTFNVSNCVADDYSVGCPAQTIKFSCDITNSAFIDYTEFRIDGVLYNASRVGQNWYVNYQKLNQTSTLNETLLFDRIRVTDTNSDTAIFDESVGVLHDCVTCTDVGSQSLCGIDDTATFYHVFEPVGCEADYNESVSCNYCSQNLVQVLGECLPDNSQDVSYYDSNYFSCCDVTGLVSDCFILSYPYNETTQGNCSYLTQDFSCVIPAMSELRNKMPFTCYLPSDDFSCVVNVYEAGRLVQVNPEYKDYSTGLLTIKPKDVETKEFFETKNSILNAYFTDKNLLTDEEFMVETICSDGDDVLTSQYMVEPFYSTGAGVMNRIVWFKNNLAYMLIAGIVLFLALVLFAWFWKTARGR